MGIHDQWAAFCLDEATNIWGMHVENKLNELDKEGNPIYTIDNIMNDKSSNVVENYLNKLGSSFKNISIVRV